MGKIKIFALLLVSILLVGTLASCGTEKVVVNVKLNVTAGDESLVTNYDVIGVQGTAENPPTVLQAVREALILLDIPMTDNDASVLSIGNYAETENEEYSYFWEYTINGVMPTSGKAGTNTIKDGDVINFKYSELDKSEYQQ